MRVVRTLALVLASGSGASGCGPEAQVLPADAGRGGAGGEDLDAGLAPASSSTGYAPPVTASGGGSDAGPSEEGWTPVEQGKGCGLAVADLSKLSFPPRVFSPCGTGCLESPAAPPGTTALNQVAAVGNAAATIQGKEILLRLWTVVGNRELAHLSRLSDGVTLAVVSSPDGLCSPWGNGPDAALLFPMGGNKDSSFDGSVLGGRASSTSPGATIVWQKHPIPLPDVSFNGAFAWDGGWGVRLYGGGFGVVTSPDAMSLTMVEKALVTSGSVAGRGKYVAYAAAAPKRAVRIYTDEHGAQTIASESGNYPAVDLTDEHIVWTRTVGPKVLDGSYDEAWIYWLPLSSMAEGVQPIQGPPLPGDGGANRMRAGGGFAATIACKIQTGKSDCRVVVVEFAMKKLWVLSHRPGSEFNHIFAVTADEVVLGEMDADSPHTMFASRIVRIGTAHLDAFAAPW